MNNGDKSKIPKLYFDGDCPMCRNYVARVAPEGSSDEVKPVDFRSSPLPQEISAKAVEHEIHLLDSDGKIYRNIDALLRVMELKGKNLWLVKIARFPIFKPFLVLGYRIIAKNRHWLFR